MYKIIKSVNTTHKGTPYRKSRRIMVGHSLNAGGVVGSSLNAGGVVGPSPFALI